MSTYYAENHPSPTSARAGIIWSRPPEDVFGELALAYEEAIQQMVRETLRIWAVRMEGWAKINAPWKDKSDAARAGLEGRSGGNQYGHWLILRHTVSYGHYLEGWDPKAQRPMQNAGKYSIIEPTLDIFVPTVWNHIKRQLGNGGA